MVRGLEHKTKKRNIILTIIILLIITGIAVVLIILSPGIQKKGRASNTSLTADEVVTGVIKKMNYQNLTPISKENISRYYEIPKNITVDYAMYISARAGTETELACFKIKDDNDEQAIVSCVNDYLASKTKSSDEQNSVQSNLSAVSAHYPYVFAVVAPDSTNAVRSFEILINETPKKQQSSAD